MICSDDDVDRHAPNPNRVTQPFGQIGKEGGDMSEMEATERYWWARVRQALKSGNVQATADIMQSAHDEWMPTRKAFTLSEALRERIAKTFTAGCAALGDPAPTKEQDHD